MTILFALLSLILIAIVVVQLGKVTELTSKIRGEEEMQFMSNRRNGFLSLAFMVVFVVVGLGSGFYYKNWFLGYGPHASASEHGVELDSMFNLTLFFTGIVFVITQILLFYFAWRYQGRKGGQASFVSHDNRLEVVWTIIPAIVMTFLVVRGLDAWNTVMADVKEGDDYIEIEATGMQFAWMLRYPGPDGQLGKRDYRLIDASNPLGQDWEDSKNWDDIQPTEIVLPVNQKVRVRITSRDVLHNFYLPHFRVKMDAVPGMPTYFVFTPTKTTEEYRQELSEYPEYNVPIDPSDPESPLKWEAFNYELACAELCGQGHFSMKRLVRIVSQAEYEQWLSTQPSFYESTVKVDEPEGEEVEAATDEEEQQNMEAEEASE